MTPRRKAHHNSHSWPPGEGGYPMGQDAATSRRLPQSFRSPAKDSIPRCQIGALEAVLLQLAIWLWAVELARVLS